MKSFHYLLSLRTSIVYHSFGKNAIGVFRCLTPKYENEIKGELFSLYFRPDSILYTTHFPSSSSFHSFLLPNCRPARLFKIHLQSRNPTDDSLPYTCSCPPFSLLSLRTSIYYHILWENAIPIFRCLTPKFENKIIGRFIDMNLPC